MTAAPAVARWLDRAVYPLLALALLGPIFFLPRMVDEPFKAPAELWLVIAAWVLTAVIGFSRALAGRPFLGGGAGSHARKLALALLGWVFLSGLFAIKPAAHWSYALGVAAYMFAAQSVLGWLEEGAGRRAWLYGLLAAVVGLEVAIGFMQLLHAPFEAWQKGVARMGLLDGWLNAVGATAKEGVPIGTLGNRNYLAELLALTTPVLVGWALGFRGRLAQAGVGLLSFTALVLMVACGSRAAALGFVVGGVVAALLVFGPRALSPAAWWATARGRVAVVGASLVLMTAIAAVGDTLVEKMNRPITTDLSVEGRVVNWQAATALWQERPLQGHGLGGYKLRNVEKLIALHPEGLPESVTSARFYQAHSDPLQGLAELGLLGAGLALAAFVFWLREVRVNEVLPPTQRLGLVWGATALVVASCFGFPLHIALTAMVFVLVLAIGLVRELPDEEPTAVGLPRMAYAMAVLALTGAVGWLAVERGVCPQYHASHYQFLGERVDRKNKAVLGGDVLFALAARHDRFRAQHVFDHLQWLMTKQRFNELLEVHAAHADEGLGMDALLLKAGALEGLKRKEEAIAEYDKVRRFYPQDHRNRRLATRRMKRLGWVDPNPSPSPSPAPAAVPSPATPLPSPAASVAPSPAAASPRP